MVVLGQVKIENSSLPVAVHVSKTRVLKLHINPFIVSQIGRFLVRVLLSRSVRSPFVGFVSVLYKSFVWCR